MIEKNAKKIESFGMTVINMMHRANTLHSVDTSKQLYYPTELNNAF